jgi:hypothetical protein
MESKPLTYPGHVQKKEVFGRNFATVMLERGCLMANKLMLVKKIKFGGPIYISELYKKS